MRHNLLNHPTCGKLQPMAQPKTDKKKPAVDKKPRGRPSSYHKEYNLAVEYMARAGMTDKQISEKLEINEQTLNNWKKAHPDFFESLKRGKESIDDQVESALLRRALGFVNPNAVKIFMPAGASEPVYAPYDEYYPPDIMACIYWLNNRRPGKWKRNPESGDDDDNRLEVVVSDRRNR